MVIEGDFYKYMVHKWRPFVEKTALLVVDMQEYFRPISSGVVENVKKLIEGFRKLKRPIIFSVHGHKDPKLNGGMLYKWWGELIIEGSFDDRIMGELTPLEGEKIIRKRRYSVFYKTDLEEYLHKEGVEDLVICGVMTNLCCETTARDAFMRDFRVFFIEDATATVNPELHLATLMNLAYGFAVIMKTDELLKHLGF